MKTLPLLLVFASLGVSAATLIPLQYAPAPATINTYAPLTRCAASGIAGGTITGVCQYALLPGPAKYHPWRTANYDVTWDSDGVPTLGAQSNSVPNFDPTKSVVVIDGTPYYYVAVDPTSGDEVVSGQSRSYLVLP